MSSRQRFFAYLLFLPHRNKYRIGVIKSNQKRTVVKQETIDVSTTGIDQWSDNLSQYNSEKNDRSETINLIEEMPERDQELETLWKEWAKKAGIFTWKSFKPIK